MKKSLWALGEDGVIFKSWVIRLLLLVMAIVAIASYSMYRADHSANAGILVEAEKLPIHTVGRGDLSVTVVEQGGLESSENTEVKCRVRGKNIQSLRDWI